MNKDISILIGGDFCVTKAHLNNNLFSKSIVEIFSQSDFNIVNLECPVLDNKNYSQKIKTGPNLKSNSNIMNYIKQLNISSVTLANNHILDYEWKGLKTTLDFLSQNDISSVGAGVDLINASIPLIIEKAGIRIAIVNFCENEWSTATSNSAGANPFDLINNLNQIKNAKSKADYVIVIIHGGHEYYNLPSPRMQKQYRFFAENGADMIIGHHPHCISGNEIHNGVPIFYSLGNFLFTLDSKHNDWYTGLILHLNINKNEMDWELLPIRQDKETFSVTLLQEDEKNKIIKRIKEYSKIIENNTQLLENWEKFVLKKYKEKIDVFSPINFFGKSRIKGLFRKLKLENIFARDTHYASMLNNIRCEAHYDLSIEAIKMKLKGN